jgi:hypothetical protein
LGPRQCRRLRSSGRRSQARTEGAHLHTCCLSSECPFSHEKAGRGH